MGALSDRVEPYPTRDTAADFIPMRRRLSEPTELSVAAQAAAAATCVFRGFDLDDRPTISGIIELPGELVVARSTVALRSCMLGSGVVVLFEQGNPHLPIIIGVLQGHYGVLDTPPAPAPVVSIHADDERFVVTAEREIVLRCGDSSITLTRAGRVIIKGNYILSRSTGYNKIKGAAVDIN